MFGFMRNLAYQVGAVAARLTRDLNKFGKQADKAINMFNKAAIKLDNINIKIDHRVNVANEHIEQLTAVVSTLKDQRTSNANVREKILNLTR